MLKRFNRWQLGEIYNAEKDDYMLLKQSLIQWQFSTNNNPSLGRCNNCPQRVGSKQAAHKIGISRQ